MRLSISGRITAVMIAGVLISGAAVLCISTVLLNRVFEERLDASVRAMQDVVMQKIEDVSSNFLREASLIAVNSALVEAVAARIRNSSAT